MLNVIEFFYNVLLQRNTIIITFQNISYRNLKENYYLLIINCNTYIYKYCKIPDCYYLWVKYYVILKMSNI